MSMAYYWRRYVLASLPMLSLAYIPVLSAVAQTAAPDSVSAQAQGPSAIAVQWAACQTSDQTNCAETFFIYRNPPGLDATLVTISVNGDNSAQQYLDRNLKPGTAYTYMVCSGAKVTGASNCGQASAKTFASSSVGSGGKSANSGSGSGNQGSANDTNTSAPPTNLRAVAGDTAVLLNWQNPQSDYPIVIEIYRALTGGSAASQINVLNGDVTVKVPPTRYQDNGPLGPHYAYDYYVCDGSYDVQMRNCAHSNSVSTWGANPLLSANRSNPTTVKLSVAVDNLITLSSLTVTRQENNGSCAQGTALANGLGCKTTSYGPNGVPLNAPVITTIYSKGRPADFGANTASAPFVIEIPDDTVSAGVEYFYQAHATWNAAVGQDSQTTTVLGGFQYLPQHQLVKKVLAGVKSVGLQPVGGTGGKVNTRPTASTRAVAAARFSAQAKDKANPADAQSLYTLGQSYCKQNLKDVCISTLYMGFLQSQKTGIAALTTQIKASLSAQGVIIH